ncbi:hypothetical protein DSO57_1004521 [Entomophthora muscae]|uniref:Uncharacterized protein n=1 Tax=Entomophthora muscae TaxID=34485 RepID=A0ACC2RN07_9FUNG|nr:hypothetical protein DSO57_1004521 [Entomophthora muscae]
MKEIPTAPPLPNALPTQDFSILGFVYITVLGLANQVVPHIGSWRPLATALNYLVWIMPIVYMAFQARPASPVGAQLDVDMGCDSLLRTYKEEFEVPLPKGRPHQQSDHRPRVAVEMPKPSDKVGPAPVNNGPRTCFKCGMADHFSRECRNPRQKIHHVGMEDTEEDYAKDADIEEDNEDQSKNY